MKKLAYLAVLLLMVSCGSTGTDSSGTGDDDDGGTAVITCADVNVVAPITCTNDPTTGRATLGVAIGDTAGTVAAGDDARLNGNGGKYLGVFTPSLVQANPPTTVSPGGLLSDGLGGSRGGGTIYNALTQRGGIRAADEICAAITNWPGKAAAVPSAHACSQDELIRNTNKGLIPLNASGLAYTTGAYAGYPTGAAPSNTNFKNSCGNWTYGSADAFTATTWTVVEQNNNGTGNDYYPMAGAATTVLFASDTTGTCGTVRPIACCE